MAKSTVKSIEKVDDFKYRVESSSGSVYQITCTGSIDLPGHPAEYGLLWDCNCPARGSCHHLQAVIKYRQENEGSEEVEFNPAEESQYSPEIAEMVNRMKAQLATGTPEQVARVVSDSKTYMRNRPAIEEKRKKAGIIALQEMGLL